MEETKTKKQKVPTLYGTIIIIIIALTVGMLVWKYEKEKTIQETTITSINNPVQKKQTYNQQQTTTSSNDANSSIYSEIAQPKLPSLADEASKSPEQLVNDFYAWYTENIDYRYYLVRKLHPDKDPVDLTGLIQKSPFISSDYEQNMDRQKGAYNSILCTNDDEHMYVKECKQISSSGNYATVEITTGWKETNNISKKIQVKLKNENNQWKISDITCSF